MIWNNLLLPDIENISLCSLCCIGFGLIVDTVFFTLLKTRTNSRLVRINIYTLPQRGRNITKKTAIKKILKKIHLVKIASHT